MTRTRIHPDDAPDLATDAEVTAHDHDADYEAAGGIATHSGDTTSVHGITDTTVLATDAEVATAVSDHAAAANPHPTYLTQAEGDGFYQPLDSDLTAIAALTTTAYGRAFLALADAAAGRTALGLGTAALAATGDFDATGAAAAAQAASQPLDSDLTALAALTTTAYGRSLLEAADAAALRTLAGLGSFAVLSSLAHSATTGITADDHHARDHAVNGSTHTGTLDDAQIPAGIARDAEVAAAYQPLDSDLTAIAALTTTAFGRGLLALADAAALAANHAHAGGVTFTTVEVSLGSAPDTRLGGHFTIAGTGMTVDKPVSIQQAVGPYTDKGTRFDEAEMDLLRVTAKVRSATVIDVYWQSQYRVRGNFKFDYVIGG